MKKRVLWPLFLALLTIAAALPTSGKDSTIVVEWPNREKPIVRFTFGKFRQISESRGQRNFSTDVVAENLWGKRIDRADFSMYVFDKDKVRIGEGYISLSNVRASETVKFQMNFTASGAPAQFVLDPRQLPDELASYLGPRLISVTVNSVPQGAVLKVDGKETGTTPKVVRLSPGKHVLEFSKEGFAPGNYPFEVGANDASGGSVTVELGGLSRDTIELRDGTVLTGDLESMDATQVVIRVGGNLQRFDRNQVKRILLVQREAPRQ